MRTLGRQRSRQSGASLVEMLIALSATGGLLVASYHVNESVQTGLVDSDRRISTMVQTSHLLDRMDGAVRSSSMMLSPFRVYDPSASVLVDGIDNDQDGLVDEMDEAFPGSQQLEQGVSVRGVWFQRVLDIDDRTVPPTVVYERPSYIFFKEPPRNPNGGSLNVDDTGVLVLSVGNEEVIIARSVVDFSARLQGMSLEIDMTVLRRKADGTTTRHSYTRKIRPKNR